jgi:trigger factor
MKVDVETVGFQKRLLIRVPPDQVRNQLDQAYRRLASQVKLSGFRPGKAPRSVLEARFADRVQADVANDLIQKGYLSAVTDHGINPVGQPNLTETGSVVEPEGFSFTIMVDVRPQVELKTWTGLDVVYPKVEVTDEEIGAAVRARLEGQAKLEEITDRPVERGDMALVELVARDGEEEIANEPQTMIRTEADPYYPGIEQLVIGMKGGDEQQGRVKFGDDARVEGVAGRELDVSVKLFSIQSYRVPEPDDEMAESLGFEGGVEGMRSAIAAQIREAREEMARNQARANLLEAIIAENPFEVPEGMVENSLKMLMEELRMQQARRSGRDPRTIGFSNAQVQDLRIRSGFAAKASLILEWVSGKEGIAVEEADVEAKFAQMAGERGQTVEAVKGWFQKEEATAELKERILEEKTLDWLLERSNLVAPAPGAPPTQPVKAAPAPAAEGEGEEGEGEAAEGAPEVLKGKVEELKAALATGSLDSQLDELLAAETGGRNRKGAVSAIEGRRKELAGE